MRPHSFSRSAIAATLLCCCFRYSFAHSVAGAWPTVSSGLVGSADLEGRRGWRGRRGGDECIRHCSSSVEESVSSCQLENTKCLCEDKKYIHAARSCVVVNCTLHDVTVWEKERARTCELPVRDRSGTVMSIEWFFGSIAIMAVTMRLVARETTVAGQGWDDAMVLFSLALMIFMAILQTLMVENGYGKDIWGVPYKSIEKFMLYQWICDMIYVPQVITMKMSIILLYLRIFPAGVSRNFRILCWASMAGGVFFIITAVFLLAFACHPIRLAWTQLYQGHEKQCIPYPAIFYLAFSANLVSDLVTFIMPVPILLSTRKMFITSFMFLLGILITMACSVRLAWVHSFVYSTNFTHDHVGFDLMSFLEHALGIVFACIPTASRLIRKSYRDVKSRLSAMPTSFSFSPRITAGSASKESQVISANTCSQVSRGAIVVNQTFSQKCSRRSEAEELDDELELVGFGTSDWRADRDEMAYRVTKAEYKTPSLVESVVGAPETLPS
ncbi:hypothetical protein EJ03DRAFT_88753 [Teratosphaeria nubilosa]|uniref:Uncharacterized protein n=1 Tax=Teratosphaeria nubilosa TaxID=161662 RepID=A0A6G1LB35_9PEZI|nr:hypothetical protein EJ03DRAFT_88753 [Teratosphaeria nubilosa]